MAALQSCRQVFLHGMRPLPYSQQKRMLNMGFFGSVSGKQVDEFACSLADEIFRLRPPENKPGNKSGSGNPGASLKNLERKVDALLDRAAAFRREHKLGIYKKARLANTFRWEMKERGYDDGFIEMITEKLVVSISKKDGAS
ncbi:MAG: hypothetical protein AB7E73_11205 [Burkholderiales bacterium]